MLALFVGLWFLCPPPDPPLSDVDCFPADARACVAFSEELEKYVKAQKIVYPWRRAELEAIREEVVACREPWRLLMLAQSEGGWDFDGFFYVCEPAERRARLARLRRLIGDEAYYSGRMPPPVPYWRFVPRD